MLFRSKAAARGQQREMAGEIARLETALAAAQTAAAEAGSQAGARADALALGKEKYKAMAAAADQRAGQLDAQLRSLAGAYKTQQQQRAALDAELASARVRLQHALKQQQQGNPAVAVSADGAGNAEEEDGAAGAGAGAGALTGAGAAGCRSVGETSAEQLLRRSEAKLRWGIP